MLSRHGLTANHRPDISRLESGKTDLGIATRYLHSLSYVAPQGLIAAPYQRRLLLKLGRRFFFLPVAPPSSCESTERCRCPSVTSSRLWQQQS